MNKSFNKKASYVSPVLIPIGVVFGAVAIALMWDSVSLGWNDIAEFLSMVQRDDCRLPKLPTPPTEGLGTLDLVKVLATETDGLYLMAVSLVGLAWVAYIAWLSAKSYLKHYDGAWAGPSPARGPATHGEARLICRPGQVRAATASWRKGDVPEGGTIVVGSAGHDELLLRECVHSCVIGRSGDGKTRRVIVPTVMANVLMGHTVVVNDIKGEIGDWICEWARENTDARVVRLRLDDPAASEVRYDPLGRARELAQVGDIGGATSELLELAHCVVPAPAAERDPFFTDGARRVFVGLALHVLTSPDVPDECRNLASVAACVTPTGTQDSRERIAALCRTLPADSPALSFMGVATSERGGGPGIASSLLKALTSYIDSEIDVIMHDDELDLSSLGERQTLLFMSSNSATGDRSALQNTLFSQTFSALRLCALRHGGRCPVPAVLVMDEFASLGRCERLMGDIGVIRSEGISVVACWQSLHQLQAVSGYGREEAKNLLDQLHCKVVLSCGDIDIASELSRTIGDYTCVATGTSSTKSSQGSGSHGTSESLTRRALITPDELMRWSASKTGTLVVTPDGTFALQSRDISKTFLAPMLGMEADGSGEALRLRAARERVVRNSEHPAVWVWDAKVATAGPGHEDGPAESPDTGFVSDNFTPEGF